ncbi:hypothetical protein BGZ47_000394 [Haplosporangium gracile]|nr:hypothetical protein BGZ47_000394 [Haplosporangium gracile]
MLYFYTIDGLLGLHKSDDWINEMVPKRTQQIYEMFAMMGDGSLPERIENKPYTHELVDYVGDYIHPVYGKIVVTLHHDGGKALHMKLRTLESRLEHYHFESFKGRVHDFVMKGNVFLTFVTGAKGDVQATEVILPGEPAPFTFKKAEVSKTGDAAAPKEE